MANHNGTASPIFIESCVVGVKVYGRRPSMFSDSKNNIRDSKIAAHLWPGLLSGDSNCFVNINTAHVCRVVIRLVTRRFVVVKINSGGKIIASKISGTPKICGLKNWSKKFRFMVRFMGLFGVPTGLG